MTESIDNIELDNKNKEILSNNFDRTYFVREDKFMEVDNLKYFNELQVIHDNINAFYDKLFDSEEEEYNYNYQAKNQIKKQINDINENI